MSQSCKDRDDEGIEEVEELDESDLEEVRPPPLPRLSVIEITRGLREEGWTEIKIKLVISVPPDEFSVVSQLTAQTRYQCEHNGCDTAISVAIDFPVSQDDDGKITIKELSGSPGSLGMAVSVKGILNAAKRDDQEEVMTLKERVQDLIWSFFDDLDSALKRAMREKEGSSGVILPKSLFFQLEFDFLKGVFVWKMKYLSDSAVVYQTSYTAEGLYLLAYLRQREELKGPLNQTLEELNTIIAEGASPLYFTLSRILKGALARDLKKV